MLLQKLKEYAELRMALPPQLYSETPVRYIIELDLHGRVLSPYPTDTADPANSRTKRGQRFMMPQVQRANVIRPLLLADKADYTLGVGGENAKPERISACHTAYKDLLERCAQTTAEETVQAIQLFLQDNPLSQLELPTDFDYSGLITFRVDDIFPTELPSVQAFWAMEHNPEAHDAEIMQCIVCAQTRPVLRRLQGKLKGVPGGQTAGTALISANSNAFESYGLETSLIAPTCAECGERFTKAANKLLDSKQNRVTIAGAAFLFWTREEVEFNFAAQLDQPDAQQVQALIESVRSGKRSPKVDATKFYATLLSGSGGRAVVRDWIDTTVGEVVQSYARWFDRQRIVDEWGATPRPLSLYWLARATVPSWDAQNIPAPTSQALLHTALTGRPLPTGMLYQAVRRSRAEQGVTRERAALIKLVLLSQSADLKEDAMVELDPSEESPAYRCGRLLAVLAEIQANAIGKAAVVDRFYGTASSAPASVFGRLVRGAQPHLSKLDRDKPGLAEILKRRLEEVMQGLQYFPPTLTLKEQGLFALGFYHQRAHDRAQISAAVARKQAASATEQTQGDDN